MHKWGNLVDLVSEKRGFDSLSDYLLLFLLTFFYQIRILR